MISIRLKNPNQSVWSWPRAHVPALVQQHHPQLQHRTPIVLSHQTIQRMGKIEYSKWIENQKKLFAVGDLVTLSIIKPQPNVCPWVLKITFIDEDHNQCGWDHISFQPAAFTVVTPSGVYNHRAPSTLRKLTPEEIDLALLQDQQPLGTA